MGTCPWPPIATSGAGMAESSPASLVERVQARLRGCLAPGDLVVDATVGQGRDTRFLAEAVGADGRVYGFDVQPEALELARQRLGALTGRVSLHLRGHESMLETLPPELRGRVAVIMFNLGYLPGGDKRLTTRPETTLAGLVAALELLSPRGCLSVVAYTGHPGGREECEAVKAWAESRAESRGYGLEIRVPDSMSGTAPEWVLIRGPQSGYNSVPRFD